MKPGDRVNTPAGPATITRIITERQRHPDRPHDVRWIIVQADRDHDRRRVFAPHHITEVADAED